MLVSPNSVLSTTATATTAAPSPIYTIGTTAVGDDAHVTMASHSSPQPTAAATSSPQPFHYYTIHQGSANGAATTTASNVVEQQQQQQVWSNSPVGVSSATDINNANAT